LREAAPIGIVIVMLIEKLPEVQALAPADKWRLIQELWHDLAPHVHSPEPDPQVVDLLERRFAAYLADPESARPQAEVFQRLAERKRAWR
jgi:putative addiction module component (TIGR02574 family)